MKKEAKITSQGIKKVLKNYKSPTAFAEFLWNGFDAKASIIEIDYDTTELGKIEVIKIKDNGTGIDLNNLSDKFQKFYDSEKSVQIQSPKNSSALHGKNGVGRLTFFTFALHAEWRTCFMNGELCEGIIKISADNLKEFSNDAATLNFQKTGTEVIFTNVIVNEEEFIREIIPYVKKEFCWFLELNKDFKIIINGVELEYSELIADMENFEFNEGREAFAVRYVQWNQILNKENSKFYFLNDKSQEVYKDFTTLNRKGDSFYHSVYITSSFFNNFDFHTVKDETQASLFSSAKSTSEYKDLIEYLNNYLRKKRKPYLRKYSEKMIEEYESSGVMPTYKNSWEELRGTELKETIMSLYEVQPKIFTKLNIHQKKTFVGFLDLLLDTNQRESIFKIIEEITSLEPEERDELANLLKSTKLDRIIRTIKLIEDRYKAYYQLKELVFNEEVHAKEVPHLQDFIERHYWIFGEEYHLVTAAEPKFEEALKRFLFKTTGEVTEPKIDHPDKKKEMDIYACRQRKKDGIIENIVLELKHPKVNLGEKEFSQVMKYLGVISSTPDFNASNMSWRFYLIGNKFDSTGYIERMIKTNRAHGEKSLAYNEDGKFKIYVKTWSEVFTEFELRHDFLDEKLKLEREKLIETSKNADEILEKSKNSSAIAPEEMDSPK